MLKGKTLKFSNSIDPENSLDRFLLDNDSRKNVKKTMPDNDLR